MMAPLPSPALPVCILGTGEYRPSQAVPSTELDVRWNKPTGWTRKHSGIDVRHFATADETSSVMAAQAARMALQRAGVATHEVDAIVSACSVMEQPIPCTAALVQRELGLGGSGIPAFDINATCLSFLAGLDLLSLAIAAGRYRRVLLVSSEIASAGLPWHDPATAMLFGDGAAAAVLASSEPGDPAAVLACHFETYGDGAAFCQIRAGGTRLRVHEDAVLFARGAVFEMDGKATYRMAAERLPVFVQRLLDKAGVRQSDLAAIVPHQASDKALRHLQKLLQLPDAMLVCILPERGNQMAASVAVALHQGIVSGRLQRGDTIALVGSGAGLSFGGCVLRL